MYKVPGVSPSAWRVAKSITLHSHLPHPHATSQRMVIYQAILPYAYDGTANPRAVIGPLVWLWIVFLGKNSVVWVAKIVRGVSVHFLAGGAKRRLVEKDFIFHSSEFALVKTNPCPSVQKIWEPHWWQQRDSPVYPCIGALCPHLLFHTDREWSVLAVVSVSKECAYYAYSKQRKRINRKRQIDRNS